MKDGKKARRLALELRLAGLEEIQDKLDSAAFHIDAARRVLDGLAGGVELGADVIACDKTSRNGDTPSSPCGE